MSHFAVVVVLPEEPTNSALEAALAPWHEFECTGRNDRYVVDVDQTEEARAEFAKSTERRLRDADGNLHDRFDEKGEWKPQFSQPDDDRFSSGRKGFVPPGYEAVDVPSSEFQSFAEWASDYHGWPIVTSEDEIDRDEKHKYGHILVGEDGEVIRCVDRTNPNSKWDWWQVGGRYGGRLAAGYDPEKDPANIETCWLCDGTGKRGDAIGNKVREADPSYTCNGCDGNGSKTKWPSNWIKVGNTARWGDIDKAELKAAKVADRRTEVVEMQVKAGLSPQDFEKGFRAYKAANAMWRELPEPRPRGAEFHEWLKYETHGDLASAYHAADTWGQIEPAEGQSIEEWIEAAPALSAYAIVIDGKWCAKGEMGWFGTSFGESDDWQSQLQTILSQIPDDHYVAVVDCHC